MNQILSKRAFLSYLAAAPVAFTVLKEFPWVGDAYAAAPAASTATTTSGPFILPPLPYKANALEKAIDGKTMAIHHGKHHQAYVDNLNKEISADPKLAGKSLDDIIRNISKYNTATRNNAGGHWNHTFFWNIMSPKQTTLSEELATAIEAKFGSLDDFKKKFEEAGTKRFGSGWVWVIVNRRGDLEIISTPNQDNPLMNDAKVKGTPILSNDVWEHAYYLRYQNKRADYLKAWWNVVNWTKVSELYTDAQGR